MSDHAQVLVFNAAKPADLGQRLGAWLAQQQYIIGPTDVLASQKYRPGPRAVDALDWTDPSPGDVEISVYDEAEPIFSPEGGYPWFSCAACNAVLEHSRWSDLRASAPVRCSACGETRRFDHWVAHESAFGTVVVFFWEWPRLRDSFLHDVRRLAGDFVVVGYHL